MSDIHLYWWSIDSATVTATRSDMSAMARRLGTKDMRGAHTTAFKRAVETTTTYLDLYAQRHTLRGQVVKQGAEFITCNVLREDGLRMAEWKFFAHRRAGNGKKIPDSHDLRTVLRAGLDRADLIATQEWLRQGEKVFTDIISETPVSALRRMCRDVANTHGVPVLGRGSCYFVYDDDREPFDELLLVLTEATTGGVIATLAVDDDSDVSVLAASADAYLSGLLWDLMNPAPSLAERRPIPRSAAKRVDSVRTQAARHERRLRLALPLTRSALDRSEEWIRALRRSGSLRSVDGR